MVQRVDGTSSAARNDVPDRFRAAMLNPAVRADIRTLADLAVIYCRGHHRDCPRKPLSSDAALLNVYGRTGPLLCVECAEHQRYGERRRASCPKDPKPFCTTCDIHCYKPDEAEWQRQMMRYSGPRSVFRGHAIDGLRHLVQLRRARRDAKEG